jgi:hypothetical protein
VSAALEAPNLKQSKDRRLVYGEDERVGRWIEEHGGGEWREGSKCIGLEIRKELIAGVQYDWHNGASIYMHVAAVGRRWLDRDFLWYAFYFPFVQLGCNVVIGLVAEDNLDARRFDEHIGFTLHTVIPDAHPSGALRVYTMRREECRWLKLKGELH